MVPSFHDVLEHFSFKTTIYTAGIQEIYIYCHYKNLLQMKKNFLSKGEK